MHDFLEFVCDRFEVVVFCKGSELSCSPVLDAIEGGCKRRFFAHRLYSDYVLFDNPAFSVKYYDILLKDGRRLAKDVVIVDSNVGAYCLDLYNGVPIYPYSGAETDRQLVALAKCLEELKKCEDVPDTIICKVNAAFATTGRSSERKSSTS